MKRGTKISRVRQWTPEQAAAFGRRLRATRESCGLSQRELSFPGCTAAYISRLEKGERYPSVVLIRGLAARLDVAADYLEFGGGAAVCAKADARQINRAVRRFGGTRLRWEDLAPAERAQVTKGLDADLLDAVAARIHAVALNRDLVGRPA